MAFNVNTQYRLICNTQHNNSQHCHYAECGVEFIVILNVVMLSVGRYTECHNGECTEAEIR